MLHVLKHFEVLPWR